MRENWYSLAHAIISGETATDAYARIYNVKKTTAGVNSSRLMANPAFQDLLTDLREAKFADTAAVRSEIVAGHLADARNEALSPSDRRAARVALSRIYGLEQTKSTIKVEQDEEAVTEWMAMLKKANEAYKRKLANELDSAK